MVSTSLGKAATSSRPEGTVISLWDWVWCRQRIVASVINHWAQLNPDIRVSIYKRPEDPELT
jgi:hypothetical protein